MTVLGIMKRSRKAAKEQQAKKMASETVQPQTKYVHVPTHAATDAMLGAPSGWNREDAHKIREHNHRRSMMQTAANSRPTTSPGILSPMHSGMIHSYSSSSLTPGAGAGSSSGSKSPGQWSRSNSGLSKVSYPAAGPSRAPTQVSLSYNSMDATLRTDGAVASGATSRTSTSDKQPEYYVTALPQSGLSSNKDHDGADVLEMKSVPRTPGDMAVAETLGAQANQAAITCAPSPARRSRIGRLFGHHNATAVAA